MSVSPTNAHIYVVADRVKVFKNCVRSRLGLRRSTLYTQRRRVFSATYKSRDRFIDHGGFKRCAFASVRHYYYCCYYYSRDDALPPPAKKKSLETKHIYVSCTTRMTAHPGDIYYLLLETYSSITGCALVGVCAI